MAQGGLGLTVAEGAEVEPIDIGSLSDYAKDGITAKYAEKGKFLVIRKEKRLYAVSTACTHKGAALSLPKADATELRCPKHDSVFRLDGTVAEGPASAALPRFGIGVNEKGHVIVDPRRQFERKEWGEAGAFIKVE